MFLKNFCVEGVLIELGKVLFSLETHKNGMGTLFRILITYTSYTSQKEPYRYFRKKIQTVCITDPVR